MLKIVNLVLNEGGISCSYAFLGICEAIFRGRDLFFCVEPHNSIYLTDIKSFFNLDNLEPAQRHPALLFLVLLPPILELDIQEQAPVCKKFKKLFDIREIYTDMRFYKKYGLYPAK